MPGCLFVDVDDLPSNVYGMLQLLFLMGCYAYVLGIGADMIGDGAEEMLKLDAWAPIVVRALACGARRAGTPLVASGARPWAVLHVLSRAFTCFFGSPPALSREPCAAPARRARSSCRYSGRSRTPRSSSSLASGRAPRPSCPSAPITQPRSAHRHLVMKLYVGC